MPARKPETIILNDFGQGSEFAKRTRFSKKTGKGSNSYSIRIDAEPLVHTFSAAALGAGPAKAIRDVIKRQIRAIQKNPSPSTMARRQRDRKAYNTSSMSSKQKKAYRITRGEKKGDYVPNSQAGLFRNSGLLQAGLAVRLVDKKGQFIVNAPANRLNNTQTATMLAREVKAVGNPKSLLREKEFSNARTKALNSIISETKSALAARLIAKRKERAALIAQAARNLVGL